MITILAIWAIFVKISIWKSSQKDRVGAQRKTKFCMVNKGTLSSNVDICISGSFTQWSSVRDSELMDHMKWAPG